MRITYVFFQEVTVPNFNLFIARDGLISYSLRFAQILHYKLPIEKNFITVDWE